MRQSVTACHLPAPMASSSKGLPQDARQVVFKEDVVCLASGEGGSTSPSALGLVSDTHGQQSDEEALSESDDEEARA